MLAHDPEARHANHGIIDAINHDLAALGPDAELVHAEVQTVIARKDPDGQETIDYNTHPYGTASTATRLGLLDIAREKLKRGLAS